MTPPKETRHADVESRLTDAELDEVVGGIANIPGSEQESTDPDSDTNKDR